MTTSDSTSSPAGYSPVVIIGAARSGTNMLRDALVRLPGVGTWPCDEINYIWRFGNPRAPHDELRPEDARPMVRQFIRGRFAQLARQQHSQWIVEKTCANSLRVGFVNEVLPEARFVFLVRDGRDVVLSALKRWKARLEPAYLLKKARFVPMRDIPYYGFRYLANRIHRWRSPDQRLSQWGPRFSGMEERLQSSSLEEVCADQWTVCVRRAREQLQTLEPQRVYQLRYEDFVGQPAASLQGLCQFLEVPTDESQLARTVAEVNANSVGRWKTGLDDQVAEILQARMADELQRYGYLDGANQRSSQAA